MNQTGFPLLTLLVWLPAFGALALLFFKKEWRQAVRVWTLVIAAGAFALCLVAWYFFEPGIRGFQIVDRAQWLPQLGITYILGLDGINLFLVGLVGLLAVVSVIVSWRTIPEESQRGYMALILLLETGVLGVFTSLDLLLFYVFWEVMLIPAYFLIGRWGGPDRVRATFKFVLYTMAGSALMLVGILTLGYLGYHSTGQWTFDLQVLQKALNLSWAQQMWLFGAFALAFAVKTPLVPFHTWLPDAYVEAPTPVTILLAGVLAKMGVYGFIRLAIPLFPSAMIEYRPYIMALAVIGILYGSLVALGQRDLKRLIAYSSLAHMSLLVLGLFALNTQGVGGAIFQSVSHGIYISALFILVMALEARRGSRLMSQFGGLWKLTPVLGFCLLVAMLASVGLPGLNGFAGEFVTLLGVFQFNRPAAILAALGMILGAWYMFAMYQRVMHGKLEVPREPAVADLRLSEGVAVLPLLALMFVFGLGPNLLYDHIVPTVDRLVQSVALFLSH